MNQSLLIGGSLLAGFALFLAKQDRLSVYGRVLWGAKPASHSADAGPSSAVAAVNATGAPPSTLDLMGASGDQFGKMMDDWGAKLDNLVGAN